MAVTSPRFKSSYLSKLKNFDGGEKMQKTIKLIVPFTVVGCISTVAWPQSVTSSAALKDVQCRQSVCTTNCDGKGEKCLVTCDDKKPSGNCAKSFYRASPYGVLEVTPPRQPSQQKSVTQVRKSDLR